MLEKTLTESGSDKSITRSHAATKPPNRADARDTTYCGAVATSESLSSIAHGPDSGETVRSERLRDPPGLRPGAQLPGATTSTSRPGAKNTVAPAANTT